MELDSFLLLDKMVEVVFPCRYRGGKKGWERLFVEIVSVKNDVFRGIICSTPTMKGSPRDGSLVDFEKHRIERVEDNASEDGFSRDCGRIGKDKRQDEG